MERLLKKARAGDKQAEKEILDFLSVRFKYLAKRRIGGQDFEDLAQEACLTVLEKYKTEEFRVNFQVWAYGVLRMKIGNYLQRKQRQSSREVALENVAISESRSAGNLELKSMLIECLRKLVREFPRYARALNLSYQGYSAEEISQRLGIKINHYYVLLNRGRTMLKECLRERGVLL